MLPTLKLLLIEDDASMQAALQRALSRRGFEVTGCTDELVDLSLETRVPHTKQHISVALRRAVAGDRPDDPA